MNTFSSLGGLIFRRKITAQTSGIYYSFSVQPNLYDEPVWALYDASYSVYYNQPDLSFSAPNVYEFDVSDPSNNGYVLSFSTTVDVSDATIESTYVTRTNPPGTTDAKVLLNLRDYSGVSLVYFEDTSTGMGYTEYVAFSTITESSVYNPGLSGREFDGTLSGNGHTRENAANLDTTNGYGGWNADVNQMPNAWMEIRLSADTNIAAVITQGNKNYDQWVTSYRIKYSTSADLTTFYDVDGRTSWTGNSDRNTKVYHYFSSTLTAQYIRIYPLTYSVGASMRAGLSLGTVVVDTAYTVTISNEAFYIDGSANPTINFYANNRYMFDQSDPTNDGQQIVFGYTFDDSANILTSADGVTVMGTPGQPGAYTQLDLSSGFVGPLYYYSDGSANMGYDPTIPVDVRYSFSVRTNVIGDNVWSVYDTSNAVWYNQPDLSFSAPYVYEFDVSDPSNNGYVLSFGTTVDVSDATIESTYVTRTNTPGTTDAKVLLGLRDYSGVSLVYFEDSSANMGYYIAGLGYSVPEIPPRPVIMVNAEGNTQVDTTIKKFGTGSCLLDGDVDYLRIDSSYNQYFSLSGDFTVELWAYKNTHSNSNNSSGNEQKQLLVSNWGPGANAFYLSFFSQSQLAVYLNTVFGVSENNLIVNYTALLNTWTHYAVVRNSGTVTIYVDGTQKGSFTYSGAIDLQEDWAFGANAVPSDPKQFFKGQLDEIRISDTARYTSNFTPATSAFINDTNTLLLLHCDGTDGSTAFLDDAVVLINYNVTVSNESYVLKQNGYQELDDAALDNTELDVSYQNVSSSFHYGSPYLDYKAFGEYTHDNKLWYENESSWSTYQNTTTYYTNIDGVNVTGDWLQVDLESKKQIISFHIVRINNWDSVSQGQLKEFYVVGSNDNTTFTELGHYYGANIPALNSSPDFSSSDLVIPEYYSHIDNNTLNTNNILQRTSEIIHITKPGEYRYLRFVMHDVYTNAAVSNIRLFESPSQTKPQIDFSAYKLYVFDQSDPTNSGQQIVFGYAPDNTTNILKSADGVTVMGTPGQPGAYTQLNLSSGFVGPLYYYSDSSANMGYDPTIPVDVRYSFSVRTNVIGEPVWALYDSSNSVWYNQPDLSFSAPYIYEFDVSDPSNNGYVLSFGTIVDVSDVTIDISYVTRTNTPGTTDAKVLLDLRDYSGVSLVYFEDSSANMGYVGQSTFPSSMNIEYLVVGGGGQGCYGYSGGGGAGGMVDSSASIISTGYSVNVEVGAGGSGQNSDNTKPGINGGNSVFGSTTAIGGGGGSRLNPESTTHAAQNGGSGGGGGPQRSDQTSYLQYVVGGQGTAGQGYAGGDGNITSYNIGAYDPEYRAGGGGGGAGGAGVGGGSSSGTAATNTSGYGGAGGPAKQWSVDGNYYAAGGGGATRIDGSPSNEQGGSGGGYTDANGDFVMLGGHGSPTTAGGSLQDATSGVANTGSGGGAGWEYNGTEATGADGVVKVWVPVTYTYSSSHVSNVTNNIGGSSTALTYNGTDGTLISFIGAGTATWSPGWVGTNVVIVTVSNEVFYLDGSANPQFDFSANNLYLFDQSDPTNDGQQLVFGYIPDNTTNILKSADGVTVMGTPGQPGAYTLLVLSSGFVGPLYYYSDGSANMGYAPQLTWNFTQTVSPPNSLTWYNFGGSCIMSRNGLYCVVGTHERSTSYTSYNAVYEYANGSWSLKGSVISEPTNQRSYPLDVWISNDGTHIATKYAGETSSTSGYVRIYEYISGDWAQKGLTIYQSSRFGAYLSMSDDGNTFACSDTSSGSSNPPIYVYDYNGNSWGLRGGTSVSVTGYTIRGGTCCISSDGLRLAAMHRSGSSATDGYVVDWNSSTQTWSVVGDVFPGVSDGEISSACYIGENKDFVTTSPRTNAYTGLVWKYDNTTNSWARYGSALASPPTENTSGIGYTFFPPIINATGTKVGYLDKQYEYNSRTNTWDVTMDFSYNIIGYSDTSVALSNTSSVSDATIDNANFKIDFYNYY